MKIKAYYSVYYGWFWAIVGDTFVSPMYAKSVPYYTRKSDAIRGAKRFERRLYQYWVNHSNSIPVEVES